MNSEEKPVELSEESELDRRKFVSKYLKIAAAISAPAWLPRVTFASGSSPPRDVFVHVFLRGGMDGLTTCCPYGDQEYYNSRPALAIAPPGQPDGAIDLDGFFGLAPAASALKPIYDAGDLAVVHAVGTSASNFSHFDAEAEVERGGTARDGWLARHLQSTDPWGNGFLRGVSLTGSLPKTLRGAPATLAVANLANAGLFPGDSATVSRRRAVLEQLYDDCPAQLQQAAINTMATIDILNDIDFVNYTPENGAVYADTDFGRRLKGTAALIKADTGVETAMLHLGGWDLHAAMGPLDGMMATLMQDLAENFRAFHLDLQAHMDHLCVLALSEFGRRIDENASGGTDHGYGNCLFAFGGGINGGQVISQWPGASGRNLNATIDYRDIVGEILEKRLASTSLPFIFPGYTPVFQGIAT